MKSQRFEKTTFVSQLFCGVDILWSQPFEESKFCGVNRFMESVFCGVNLLWSRHFVESTFCGVDILWSQPFVDTPFWVSIFYEVNLSVNQRFV